MLTPDLNVVQVLAIVIVVNVGIILISDNLDKVMSYM